jgi:DNA-binding NtrC family response regulator
MRDVSMITAHRRRSGWPEAAFLEPWKEGENQDERAINLECPKTADVQPDNSHKSSSPTHLGLRYFHLLADHDLEALHSICESIVEQQNAVIEDWYQQYAAHFGDSCTLSRDEFARIFGEAFQHAHFALLRKDINGYSKEISNLGDLLGQRRMPLAELIASIHFFRSSVRSMLYRTGAFSQSLDIAFDKLSDTKIILLVSEYFRLDATKAKAGNTTPEHQTAARPVSSEKQSFHGLVGATAEMRQLHRLIKAAAASKANLLIIGESGTGKELVARAVHKISARSEKPFVAVNCAAIPKDLIESELFGYKRGAFSGATADSPGLFRAAEGGTLFLDEITEMSAETQSKLLRAIQERAIRPVGATREIPVDVRLIASSNRDPKSMVTGGHLREDLYYRLQSVVLAIPPLRQRRSDIPLLIEHFIRIFNERLERAVTGIDGSAFDALLRYDWPGNVRELSNAIERAFTFGMSNLISLDDLPEDFVHLQDRSSEAITRETPLPPATHAAITLAEMERQLIAQTLRKNGGNKASTAKQLKISRKQLYSKIDKYNLAKIPE